MSYPYSFVKIMLKDGKEYLFAVKGAAMPLILALKSLGLTTSNLE